VRALALLVALAGCGPTAIQLAQKSITAADQVQTAGAGAFAAWDNAHQQAIVDAGRADGSAGAKIAAYRAVRDKVVAAFTALADASHVAKEAATAAGAGSVNLDTLAPVLGALWAAGLDLYKQAKVLGFTVPGLDKLLPASVFSQPPPSTKLMRRLTWAVA
jgi:hypothetical protein